MQFKEGSSTISMPLRESQQLVCHLGNPKIFDSRVGSPKFDAARRRLLKTQLITVVKEVSCLGDINRHGFDPPAQTVMNDCIPQKRVWKQRGELFN